MSHYSQYGYYDPIGSHSNAPSGYTYQTSSSNSTAAYNPVNYSFGINSGQQSNNLSATNAAAALSSLSGQNYNQSSSNNHSYSQDPSSSLANTASQRDNSTWYSSTASASNSFGAPRTQSNASPIYATAQSSSTLNPLNLPSLQRRDQSYQSTSTQSQSQTLSQSHSQSQTQSRTQSYSQSQSQPQSQPPRYNSPLHAVQAQQQRHAKSASRGSNHAPSATTVDPSQVYDNRAELQRKAQIEAERRRKIEEEQAAQRAKEERVEAERRKAEEEARRKSEEVEQKKKAEQEQRSAQKRKAREEKRLSKSAATTLQQMATTGPDGATVAAAMATQSADPTEAEIRAMFVKMRELNAKNPTMLAKVWEEERVAHQPAQSHSQAQPPQVSKPAPPGAKSTKPAAQKKSGKAASPAAQKGPAGLPPPQQAMQADDSVGPARKGGSVNEARAKWLVSLPQNGGKQISAEALWKVLDKNPSYVQLCEQLEGLGFSFERTALARELLKVVPDSYKAPGSAQKSTTAQGNARAMPARTHGSDLRGLVDYSRPLSLSDAAAEVKNVDNASPAFSDTFHAPQRSPSFAIRSPLQPGIDNSRPTSQPQPPETKKDVKPEAPPRPPADKEEAARKRTFGDLVDLTAEDSDEEKGPPRKMVHISESLKNRVDSQVRHDPGFLAQPTSFQRFMYPRPGQDLDALRALSVPAPPVVPSSVVQQAPSKPKGPTAEQEQQMRVRGKMLVEPIMRDRVARKSRYDSKTIARDVLLATGRHPDMRPLNAHLAPMQKLLGQHGGEGDAGGNRSDLSTVRWDVVDPGEPEAKATGEKSEESVEVNEENVGTSAPSAPRDDAPSGMVEYRAPEPLRQVKRRRRKVQRTSEPRQASALLTNGLGRAKNSTPGPSSVPTTPASAKATPESGKAMAASSASVGYAQFRQLDADGNPIKKKGRPIGWRKHIHSREAAGLPRASTPRTVKTLTESAAAAPVQEPKYAVYKCKWEACNAELHNINTLKQHVAKVHGDREEEEEMFVCRWSGCGVGSTSSRSRLQFRAIEDFMLHVDKQHLQRIAWKLGDGPKSDLPSHPSSTSPPPYLLDSSGRRVTPTISPTPLASTRSVAGPLRKLEEHQRAVGPVLGRMGCILANEARRATFLDGEDFEDVGYGSEYDDDGAFGVGEGAE